MSMPLKKRKRREPAMMPNRPAVLFRDLDRVKLRQDLDVEGHHIGAGSLGTIVFCQGSEAYEVEFEGINDFFQISPAFLEKVGE